jgi:hypothetical protein
MATSSHTERTPSFSELLVDLGQDVSALVHDEIDLVKKETRSELRTTLLVMGSAAVLVIAAVLTLCAAAVLALARVLDPPLAALAVGGAIAVIAVGVGLAASGQSPRPAGRSPLTINVSKENL